MFEVQFRNLEMVESRMHQICFIEVLLGGDGHFFFYRQKQQRCIKMKKPQHTGSIESLQKAKNKKQGEGEKYQPSLYPAYTKNQSQQRTESMTS